jgi:ribosomal protein S10
MFLKIVLLSKNNRSLNSFLKTLKTLKCNKRLQLRRILLFINKKRVSKTFTILKSPHVNKTAQEQFELNFFSKDLKIQSFQLFKILLLLKKIQSLSFSDVQIKIRFGIQSLSKQSTLINNLKLKLLNRMKKKKYKQVKLLLFFVNLCGKLIY